MIVWSFRRLLLQFWWGYYNTHWAKVVFFFPIRNGIQFLKPKMVLPE